MTRMAGGRKGVFRIAGRDSGDHKRADAIPVAPIAGEEGDRRPGAAWGRTAPPPGRRL
ncbi:hypothetical protein GCM10010994_52710 [Chelatococcus reniformis]|uniref:Uncharacterized protein n=1 Tax=Chelatococcus reniformis TaxID=1494448 RepID=A0A916XP28_9HYPH|nr:hypothetical protein GCM10010994_52710 [Chelatococcus reniformis]